MSSALPSSAAATAEANWLVPRDFPAAEIRRGRLGLALALLAYVLATWLWLPHGIGFSWRECDTQAIARNFLVDGFDPLHPRVDWRGTTPGYVECEFPLYQLMIATTLAAIGDLDAEWPGRLISMLSVMLGALSLHRLLERRAGPAGALAGTIAFLCTGSAMLLGTRVMPDALSLGLGVAALLPFVRYLESGSGVALALSASALALSALQKPLALQLGLLLFAWTALLAPRRLREPRLWIAFAAVVGVVGAWLVHGKNLHAETGLSFGVVSGGDTKFPALEHFLQPEIYVQLGKTTAQYGFSMLAGVALFALLARRRLDRADLALLGAVGVGLLVSLRYSYSSSMGPHYHAFAALAGAWCIARAWPARAAGWQWAALVLLATAHAGWRLEVEERMRHSVVASPVMQVAAEVRSGPAPKPLAVVRAEKPRFDPLWRRTNNFEDPRFLYQSRLRGWVVPLDGFDEGTLIELHGRGARLVYDPLPGQNSPEVTRWLDQNGEIWIDRHGVRVHRLHERL
ncbi:MAG: glycosyltransferase family 39 protein [Planctomycetes bacterium]|nr:glycosyltransferase family 39 protein [Planctomycetota bacterium]